MRRVLSGAAAVALLAAGSAVALTASGQAAATPPRHRDAYEWSNVEIVGGGFVPGFVFNVTEPDLIYARTDIGGAYRWDEAAQRWIPLLDWVGWDEWGWTGVVSLASDPVDPDRVYVAAGTYTNDWDPNNGAILRSADRGVTWQVSPLPFKLGGNMPGRGMGERLVVDPNDNSVLYLGAPEGNGLWRSTDFGTTWQPVASFPNPGDWAQDPADPNGYLSHRPGVVWVTFDPRTGTPGSPTRTIYAGVADLDSPVYHSTDAGATWEPLAGAPTGLLVQKGVLDHAGGFLYLASSDNSGPYEGCRGEVWRYDTAAATWTDITPQRDECWFGYSGLTVDRQDPDTVMVTGYSSWWPDTFIFRSTDRGATWGRFWDFGEWPNRSNRYELDTSAAPWLSFGTTPELPEQSPKLGWMTQGMEIDPHDSDRFLYGTGATVFGADNLTDFDSGGMVAIEVKAEGLEETAIADLLSPPAGPAHLLSAVRDLGGFRHTSFDAAPELMFQNPYFNNGTSLDHAAQEPAFVVRVGETDRAGHTRIGFSGDGGVTWTPGTEPAGVTAAGTVAAASDASRVVWSPDGAGVHWSADSGATWTAATGVPAGARVAADRVDPRRFYAAAGGAFYRSDDGGVTFAATATGLPAEGNVRFAAVPGYAGHVWLAGGVAGNTYGMWRSTDGGRSFRRIAAVDEGDAVGFGKPAPGRAYPAIYASAKINGGRGIFRSDDAGRHWVRINDDAHQWAWTGAAISGDPRVYGRVYVATNGRGIIVGDRAGVPAARCAVAYRTLARWPGGFLAAVSVTNTGGRSIAGWALEWTFAGDEEVERIWGATAAAIGADVAASNATWNATIRPRRTVTLGFVGASSGTPAAPSGFTLNGSACAVR